MSCLKPVKEFDKDLVKLAGPLWCQFFGDVCLRKHFRLELKKPELKMEIIKAVCNDGQNIDELSSPNGFISPKYWMNILDGLNSKYVHNGASIKSLFDWKYIARYFLNYIASKPLNMNDEWYEAFSVQINKIINEKKFQKIEDLINYLISSDQSDAPGKSQECATTAVAVADPKQSEKPEMITENLVLNMVNEVEQNELSREENSQESTQISAEEVDDEHENNPPVSPVFDIVHIGDEPSQISSKESQSAESIVSEENQADQQTPIPHDKDEENEEVADDNNHPDKPATTMIDMFSEEGSLIIDESIVDESSESDSDDQASENQQTLPILPPPALPDVNEPKAGGSSMLDWTQDPLPMERFDRKLLIEDKQSSSNPDVNVQDSDEDDDLRLKKTKIQLNKVFRGPVVSEKVKLPKRAIIDEEDSSDSFQTIPDSDDETCSTSSSTILDESTMRSYKNNRPKGKPYSVDEDLKILDYIFKFKRFPYVKGHQLWKDMEDRKVCPGRSWQSMKERFKKTICAKLEFYQGIHKMKKSDVEELQLYGYNCDTKTRYSGETSGINKSQFKSGYTLREDDEIIKFVVANLGKGKITGNKIWIMLSKHFQVILQRDRTWQSLKERFKKRILPSFWTYELENKYKYEQIMQIIRECSNSLMNVDEVKRNVAAKFKKN